MSNDPSKSVLIIDATLREGTQSPGVCFNDAQVKEILLGLNKIGVDMVEVGHPASSKKHLDMVKDCVKNSALPCLAHARARHEDILAVHQTGATWVGIFAGVNEISRNDRITKSYQEILKLISESIKYAKSLGLKVRYTVEDASTTAEKELLEAYKVAIEAGADRICFADTIGILEPSATTSIIQLIRNHFPDTDLEVHFHDDRGLALANTLAAIDAGASWVSTTVNGLGERCGITDTVSLIANLDFRGTRKYPHELKELKRVSTLVASHSRSSVDDRHPITGRNAFTHTAKLHVNAIQKNEKAYCWRAPSDFALENKTVNKALPQTLAELINIPPIISATELRHHRNGPGSRYVMIDERFIADCRQYCIVRDIDVEPGEAVAPHVDVHRHNCDSLFLFIGKNNDLTGLTVSVRINDEEKIIKSPASVFIPAGLPHTYRVIGGRGLYINHVLSGTYNESLLE